MSTQKLSLIAYKTGKGLYYANSKWDYRNEREGIYNSLLINEKLPVKSEYKSSWYFLEGEDEHGVVWEIHASGDGDFTHHQVEFKGI
jgi:hypothetical protein